MRTPEQIIGKDALTQLVFEGYAVVPTKPTDAMLNAAQSRLCELENYTYFGKYALDIVAGLSDSETDRLARASSHYGEVRRG